MDFKKLINQGKDSWNKWMEENNSVAVDLGGMDFSGADLSGYNLSIVGGGHANFSKCVLRKTDFSHSDLVDANFQGADIAGANFDGANLTDANLNEVTAKNTDFYQASLELASVNSVAFHKASFAFGDKAHPFLSCTAPIALD